MKIDFTYPKSCVLALLVPLALSVGCDPEPDPDPTGAGDTASDPTGAADTGNDPTGGTDTGSDPTGSADTGVADTGATDTGEPEPGCYILDWKCEQMLPDRFICDSPSPCATLEVNDPSLNEFGKGKYGFVNPEAATCIAEGLRDGTAGTYNIEVEPGQQYSRTHALEVLPDATVIMRNLFQDDKCLDYSDAWEELAPAAHFEGCLAEKDPALMLSCMLDAGTGTCIASETVCPE